jgi:hypothetical protein
MGCRYDMYWLDRRFILFTSLIRILKYKLYCLLYVCKKTHVWRLDKKTTLHIKMYIILFFGLIFCFLLMK